MNIGKNLRATLLLSIMLICMAQAACTQKVEQEITTASYCDLLRKPEQYDKRTVRLKAFYIRGFEQSELGDPKCKSQESTWVKFDPAYSQCTKADIQKKLDGFFKKGGRAELTVVGQFNGRTLGWYGYGHMNASDYQFVIKCVEQVKPVFW